MRTRYAGGPPLYALEGDGLPADAVVERWQGWEQLSHGYAWWVDLLSTDADWVLDDVLGQPVALTTRLADGSTMRRSGIVAEASALGADGGLARYRLQLVPWTWWLTQGRHSRLFQEQDTLAIVAAVFESYAPLADWQVADEVGPYLAAVPLRSYCVQYRESDFDFISRLLAEDGLGLRWEEDAAAPAGHRVVVFADSTVLPEVPGAADGIRFHRSDATESSDTVQAIGQRRRLGPATLTLISSDYKRASAITAQAPLQSDATPRLGEVYDPAGAYAATDAADAARRLDLLAEAHEAAAQRWQGQGTVPVRAGTACVASRGHDHQSSAADARRLQRLHRQRRGRSTAAPAP